MRSIRVLIDARVPEGRYGGVQQTIIGLAQGFSALDGDDTYLFLVDQGQRWLAPHLGAGCHQVEAEFPSPSDARIIALAPGGAASAPSKAVRNLLEGRGRVIPRADPAALAARPHVVHFLRQRGFRTMLPNIYQPHDLQYASLPAMHSRLTRLYRRRMYRTMAGQASRIIVMATSGIDEVVRHLDYPKGDVAVVPWAPVNVGQAADTDAVPVTVPEAFLFFPAQTWPHKNHVRLVEALRLLRAQGVDMPLVLTGWRNAHWPAIETAARDAGVSDLVYPLGFVPAATVQWLYRHARIMVFPSLYEGWGLPVVEALRAGVAVACSDIAPVNALVADAGRLFDPTRPHEIAATLRQLWTDDTLRDELSTRAVQRGSLFTWDRVATLLRAHYRTLAGVADDRDAALLAEPPLV